MAGWLNLLPPFLRINLGIKNGLTGHYVLTMWCRRNLTAPPIKQSWQQKDSKITMCSIFFRRGIFKRARNETIKNGRAFVLSSLWEHRENYLNPAFLALPLTGGTDILTESNYAGGKTKCFQKPERKWEQCCGQREYRLYLESCPTSALADCWSICKNGAQLWPGVPIFQKKCTNPDFNCIKTICTCWPLQ